MTDPDLRDPNLDRAYRETPRDEPPAALDERIRAAARRAVSTKPQSLEREAADRARRSWTSRWRVPLSVAATLVIAATLTVMVQEEERRPRDDAGRPAAPAAVVPAQEAERPAPPASSTPDVARSAPAPAAPRSTEPDTAAGARASGAPAPLKAASQPRPAAPAEPLPEHQKLEERVRELQRQESSAATPPQRVVPSASPAAPAPAPLSGASPAPKPALQAPAGAATDSLRRDRTLGDRPERASREASANAIRSPEAWVELVRGLRAQGREAEATAELAELRRAYPDFRLPPDLAR
jgi:hypothetical protein